jgi:hypothetical protein
MMSVPDEYRYVNDFMYFVLKRDRKRGEHTFLYCSGVNLLGFLALTGGRHGLASNPALRGLQLVNLDIRALALSRGAMPKALRTKECSGEAPRTGEWYSETLLIENTPETLPEEVISHGSVTLVKKIAKACLLEHLSMPDEGTGPEELQSFIEALCSEYGRPAGPR